jgi:hypothetical protein
MSSRPHELGAGSDLQILNDPIATSLSGSGELREGHQTERDRSSASIGPPAGAGAVHSMLRSAPVFGSGRVKAGISRGRTAGAGAIDRAVLRVLRLFLGPAGRRALLAVFLAFFIVDGVLGVDFGAHWDEGYQLGILTGCIQRLSLLPAGVSYGGIYFTLGMPLILAHELHLLPALLRDVQTQPGRTNPVAFPSVVRFQSEAVAFVNSGSYVLQVRTLFLVVTSATLLWAYLAARRDLRGRRGPALAAAAFMAFSWQFGYHARWLAIDAPITQFAMLHLFLFVSFWRSPLPGGGLRWYAAAAAAAGAVVACKITGLVAVLPIILGALLRPRLWSLSRRLALAAAGGAIALVSTFLLSPAYFFDPLQMLYVVRGGAADYNPPPGDPYWVGTDHLWRTLVWLFAAVPSPFVPIAVMFTAVAVIGFASLLRRDTRMTLAWLSFPAALLAAFSRNHMLLVRQYLMCVPILALAFARGASVVWDWSGRSRLPARAGFVTIVVAGFAAGAVFETRQAWRVTHDTPASIGRQAADDLLADRTPVRMYRAVYERLHPYLGIAYSCHPAQAGDRRVGHLLAGYEEHIWRSNRLGYFRHVYGAPEVDLDYYTTWFGRSYPVRLVDVPIARIAGPPRAGGLDVDCFPSGRGPW